ESMSRAFGLPVGQTLTREQFRVNLHPDDQLKSRDLVNKLFQEGGSASVELRMRDGAGWGWLRTPAIAETKPDGGVAIHGLAQDVTEVAEAREAALRAERQGRGLMEESR